MVPFFCGSAGQEAEDFVLSRIIRSCVNAFSISMETTGMIAETWRPCLYTLFSICASSILTRLATHDGASPDIIHMLTHVVRFATGLEEICVAGHRPAWSEPVYDERWSAPFGHVDEFDRAFDNACRQLLLALADAGDLTHIHLSSAFIPATINLARTPVWDSSLSRLSVCESRSGPWLGDEALRSIASACRGGSLEKLVTSRGYLPGFKKLIEEEVPEGALFRLTVWAPNGSMESDEEDEDDFDVDYSLFRVTDLHALSSVSLKVLSLYGEESAALAHYALSTKPFAALKRLKLRSEVKDLASLQAIRVILQDRGSIDATWNGTRVEDLDYTEETESDHEEETASSDSE